MDRSKMIEKIHELYRSKKHRSIDEFKRYAIECCPATMRTARYGRPYKCWEDVVNDYVYDLRRMKNYLKV